MVGFFWIMIKHCFHVLNMVSSTFEREIWYPILSYWYLFNSTVWNPLYRNSTLNKFQEFLIGCFEGWNLIYSRPMKTFYWCIFLFFFFLLQKIRDEAVTLLCYQQQISDDQIMKDETLTHLLFQVALNLLKSPKYHQTESGGAIIRFLSQRWVDTIAKHKV